MKFVVEDWMIAPTRLTDPDSTRLLRAYFTDIVARYYLRPPTSTEVDAAMAEDPSGDITDPIGLFLIAWHHGVAVGCLGLRMVEPEIVELTRMFVCPSARRRGGGSRLIATAEQVVRGLGARIARLDTRDDLVEAHAFYTHHGYIEVPPFFEGQSPNTQRRRVAGHVLHRDNALGAPWSWERV